MLVYCEYSPTNSFILTVNHDSLFSELPAAARFCMIISDLVVNADFYWNYQQSGRVEFEQLFSLEVFRRRAKWRKLG